MNGDESCAKACTPCYLEESWLGDPSRGGGGSTHRCRRAKDTAVAVHQHRSYCTNGATHLQVLQLLLYPDMDDAEGFSLSFDCTQQTLRQQRTAAAHLFESDRLNLENEVLSKQARALSCAL